MRCGAITRLRDIIGASLNLDTRGEPEMKNERKNSWMLALFIAIVNMQLRRVTTTPLGRKE